MSLWRTIELGKLQYDEKEKIYHLGMYLTYEGKLAPNNIKIQATREKIVHIDVDVSFCYPLKTLEETIELSKQVFQETYQQELLDIIVLSENIKRASSLSIQNFSLKQRAGHNVGYFTIEEILKEISMFFDSNLETISFTPNTIDFSKDVAELLKEALFAHSTFRLKLLPFAHYKTV